MDSFEKDRKVVEGDLKLWMELESLTIFRYQNNNENGREKWVVQNVKLVSSTGYVVGIRTKFFKARLKPLGVGSKKV